MSFSFFVSFIIVLRVICSRLIGSVVFVMYSVDPVWLVLDIIYYTVHSVFCCYVQSMIYRFFFALIYTAVCGVLTVVAFGMGQIYESHWKYLESEEGRSDFEINSAFQLGEQGNHAGRKYSLYYIVRKSHE